MEQVVLYIDLGAYVVGVAVPVKVGMSANLMLVHRAGFAEQFIACLQAVYLIFLQVSMF